MPFKPPQTLRPPFVIVFIQAHCPACHDFMPTFKAATAPYQRCGVPIFAPDVSDPRARAALASGEEWNVEATPTTVIAGPGGKIKRFEGAISQRKLERALRETLYA